MGKKILKLFGKEVLSIDIGTHTTKFVVGSSFGGEVSVERMVSVKTPEDLYHDGQIINIKNLKDFIERVIRDEKLKSMLLSFTFESSSLIMKEVTLPYVKTKDLKQMIEFEIEQYLPIDMSQYNIQYKLIGSSVEDGVKKSNFLVAALPKSISDSYLQLSNMLGIKPYALDIHSNCIDKLFRNKTMVNGSYDISKETIAILDLGYHSTKIVIIEKGAFKFSRLLTSGGNNIGYQEESMINEMIISGVNNWMQDIDRVFKFYTTRATGNRIDKIFIHGGSIRYESINKIIEEFFSIPTFKIKSITGINIDIKKSKKIYDSDSNDTDISPYVNAIGAIIRR